MQDALLAGVVGWAGNLGPRVPHERGEHRVPHLDARQSGEIGDGRVVARRVQAVRIGVVGVRQAQAPGLGVHHRHEARLAAADVVRQVHGSVVGAWDEQPLEELHHRQSIAGMQTDR